MSYLDFKDLVQRKPGSVNPPEKNIMRKCSNLIDRRNNLRFTRRTKVENAEYSVITEILIERGEIQID